MQKGLKLNAARVAGIVALLAMLVGVRFFQEQLFYDPLVAFFKQENKILPEYDTFRLFASLFFRYALNSAISLAIIWLFFKNRPILRLSAILYGVFFIVLIAAFFIIIASEDVNLLLLFYIRRFIIQPLFLILFIPAFYYQRKMR